MTNNAQRYFAVGYYTEAGQKLVYLTHLIYASSRKDAENATRFLEEPAKIRISRVTPIDPTIFGETNYAE